MKIFIKISTFLKRDARVQNSSLDWHQSWYSGKIKLQYNSKGLNVNRTCDLNAKYHLNWNIHVPFYGSSRGRAFSKTLRFGITLLACRAGGKPSTWLPPGTRRAVNVSDNLFYHLFLWDLCNFEIIEPIIRHWNFPEFWKNIQYFLNISMNTQSDWKLTSSWEFRSWAG